MEGGSALCEFPEGHYTVQWESLLDQEIHKDFPLTKTEEYYERWTRDAARGSPVDQKPELAPRSSERQPLVEINAAPKTEAWYCGLEAPKEEAWRPESWQERISSEDDGETPPPLPLRLHDTFLGPEAVVRPLSPPATMDEVMEACAAVEAQETTPVSPDRSVE